MPNSKQTNNNCNPTSSSETYFLALCGKAHIPPIHSIQVFRFEGEEVCAPPRSLRPILLVHAWRPVYVPGALGFFLGFCMPYLLLTSRHRKATKCDRRPVLPVAQAVEVVPAKIKHTPKPNMPCIRLWYLRVV